jgi:hypothetical protein
VKKQEFQDLLVKLDACEEARDWVAAHPGATARTILRTCPRGDWLLWLAARLDVDRKVRVFTAAQCARQALKYTTDPCVEACLVACEQWSRGEISDEALQVARKGASAAASAAFAASASAAVDAVEAAAASAYVADAADAANAAASVATYAAYAAAYAAYYTARKESLAASADLVRKHIPWSVMAAALKVVKARGP